MTRPEIGLDIGDLPLDPKRAMRWAAEHAFSCVELSTVAGELAPDNLSHSGRRHLARMIAGYGLKLSALVADVPGARLTEPSSAERCTLITEQILRLARSMDVAIVTASVPSLSDPSGEQPSLQTLDVLARVGDIADGLGVNFALRPARDSAEQVVAALDRIACPSLKIGIDPAAMVMAGMNPLSLIERAPERIVLAHVRDATVGRGENAGHETRLGEGEVDLIGFFQALRDIDFPGPLIVRCSNRDSATHDLLIGKHFVEQHARR